MNLYTAQYSYRGDDRVDTTVKTGLPMFAPTWDIVMGVKRGDITEEAYTEVYYKLMRDSYRDNKEDWDKFLARESATIVCFCPYEKNGERVFCHRHLLKDMLVLCGATYLGERGK